MRQHDPILGVITMKLSNILQTSSQVTRWYPLNGGVGFGRARISLLFRSVETRLPPAQLGWDVGTFEFRSEKIIARNFNQQAKIKLRTGGSSGKISKRQCHESGGGDGVYWSPSKKLEHGLPRLPVKYRYRSPVIFEFYTAGRRHPIAYSVFWLHHLEDNKQVNLNIPIWKTDNGLRLTQNYITEENFQSIPDLNVEKVGRLEFDCRFKAGADEDHERFVTDNDSRETQETWDACHSQGVRDTIVTKDLSKVVQELHDQSLTQGRDVLSQAKEEDRKKWLSKDGTDWSGAFGRDPTDYLDHAKASKTSDPHETGGGRRVRDLLRGTEHESEPSSDDDEKDNDSETDSDTSSSADLGIVDATTRSTNGNGDGEDAALSHTESSHLNPHHGNGPIASFKEYKKNKKGLHRKQRGLMQWKPIRNVAFAKDNAKFAVRRALHVGKLEGRQPGVDSEV